MTISIETNSGATIVHCKDVSNIDSYVELKHTMKKLFDEGKCEVIFDFNETEYMSSMGIAVIIECVIKGKENKGNVRICGVHKRIEKIMKTLGVYRQMPVFETIEDALSDVKKIV